MKFFIRTLGCKMNWLDSARITANLQQAGHIPVADETEADLVFINSCTVTSAAERKSRKEARAVLRREGEVAVMGCAPRIHQDEWQNILPNERIFQNEADIYRSLNIEPDATLLPQTSRTRLPIAIQSGCDNQCTFCITRVARGSHISLPTEQIVAQVRQAEEMGVKEVVLTGINLGAWGCSDSTRPEESRLPELLESLLEETGMPRIRISSLGPQFVREDFFQLYADPRICDHLHLSVQSGATAVLRQMERGHGKAEIAAIAEQARRVRPDTAITADMIVGFPGESDADFEETLAFVREIGFAKLHVFPYSTREGTPAATMSNQIDGKIKKERAARLRALGRELRQQFMHGQDGRHHPILVEQDQTGLTTNYLRLKTPADCEGEIITLTVSPETLVEPLTNPVAA